MPIGRRRTDARRTRRFCKREPRRSLGSDQIERRLHQGFAQVAVVIAAAVGWRIVIPTHAALLADLGMICTWPRIVPPDLLADVHQPVAAVVSEVEMEMIAVEAVVVRTEHGREIFARTIMYGS